MSYFINNFLPFFRNIRYCNNLKAYFWITIIKKR
nr:MAG TPA: hypothetical protein [Caudoviricetes sp.]